MTDTDKLSLVRETKGKRDFLSLRTSEAAKCAAASGTLRPSASPSKSLSPPTRCSLLA
jgi:hypothetical protein